MLYFSCYLLLEIVISLINHRENNICPQLKRHLLHLLITSAIIFIIIIMINYYYYYYYYYNYYYYYYY